MDAICKWGAESKNRSARGGAKSIEIHWNSKARILIENNAARERQSRIYWFSSFNVQTNYNMLKLLKIFFHIHFFVSFSRVENMSCLSPSRFMVQTHVYINRICFFCCSDWIKSSVGTVRYTFASHFIPAIYFPVRFRLKGNEKTQKREWKREKNA